MEETVYWTKFKNDLFTFYIACTDKGLAYVGADGESYSRFEDWANRVFKAVKLVEAKEKLTAYREALMKYCVEELTDFNLLLDLRGTDFQKIVWDGLLTIPYGETVSYSNIAEKINRPTAVRAVASAVGKNPVTIIVPCHRVIAKDGSIGGFSGGLSMKRKLLQIEAKK